MLFEQMFERLMMSRNYGVSTRSLAQVRTNASGLPKSFSWRGHSYLVLTILFTWLESAPWWRTRQAREWQVWRVEATSQSSKNNFGIYDIATSDERWFVYHLLD
jgi:hypothetical protein